VNGDEGPVLPRRRFLKGLGVAGLAAVLRLPFGASGVAAAAGTTSTVTVNGVTYRVNGTGKVLQSRDGGATWKVQSDLGSIYSISTIKKDSAGRVRIDVGYSGSKFGLVLDADGIRWRTV
jgi:hypothetical protein